MYSPEEYKPMKFRVDEVPLSIRVTDRIPELENIFREYLNDMATDEITIDQLIRYIVYCYHKNSPLVKKISNPGQRKVEAWTQAGVDPKLTDARDISDHKNEKIAEAILQFLVFERDADYLTLTYRKEAYHRLNLENAKGGQKFSAAMYNSLRDLESDIERLSNKMTSGDTLLMNHFDAFQVKQNRKLAPEDYAE